MAELKNPSWLWRLLGGLVLVVLGILVIAYPGLTLGIVVVIFGVLMLVEGFIQVVFGLSVQGASSVRVLFIVVGFVSIILGLLAIITPFAILIAGWILIAVWAILWGVFEIAATLMVPAEASSRIYGKGGKNMALIVGLIAIILGVVFIAYPEESIVAVVWIAGGLVILIGLMISLSALQLRTLAA